jgi:hypothetical protein
MFADDVTLELAGKEYAIRLDFAASLRFKKLHGRTFNDLYFRDILPKLQAAKGFLELDAETAKRIQDAAAKGSVDGLSDEDVTAFSRRAGQMAELSEIVDLEVAAKILLCGVRGLPKDIDFDAFVEKLEECPGDSTMARMTYEIGRASCRERV